MDISIRPATPSDLPLLSQIEHASDQLLRTVDLSPVADLPPYLPEHYNALVEAGQVWLASPSSPSGSLPVAFVSVKIFENECGPAANEASQAFRTVYINQLSVDPQHSRQGIGTKMMQHVEAWVAGTAERRRSSFHAVELTTFASVPFNRPFYERLGYRVLSDEELEEFRSRGVRAELVKERSDEVLKRWERVAMRKIL